MEGQMNDPVMDAILQRRDALWEEIKDNIFEYDNFENMVTLMKINAFLFKKTLTKILSKTILGYIHESTMRKAYKIMMGLVKNVPAGIRELEASDHSVAVALSVEKDIRKARIKCGRYLSTLSLIFADYIYEDILIYDEVKEELVLFNLLREQFDRVTSTCAVAVLRRADLSIFYGPVIDGQVIFYTEDHELIQYVVQKFPDQFKDYQ